MNRISFNHPLSTAVIRVLILLVIHTIRHAKAPLVRVGRRVLRNLSRLRDAVTLDEILDEELPKLDRDLRVLAKTRREFEWVRTALNEWRLSRKRTDT